MFKKYYIVAIFISIFLIQSTESCFKKRQKERSFKRIFKNSATVNLITYSYNGNNFSTVFDITKVNRAGNLLYYISDYIDNATVILDKNWNFVDIKRSVKNPWSFIAVENDGYLLSEDYKFQKTDLDLNVVKSVPENNKTLYTQVRHDKKQNVLYVSNNFLNRLEIYSRDLVLLDQIVLPSDRYPFNIMQFDGKLYVSATRRILEIENRIIINSFLVPNCSYIQTTLMDDDGNIAIGCNDEFIVYVYKRDGTYTGWYRNINKQILSLAFDYDNDLLVGAEENIFIIN